RGAVALRAEEQLQHEDAPVRLGLVLVTVEPRPDRRAAGRRDRVQRLVRPVGLADVFLAREPGGDEPAEDGVELRLRRLPDVADGALDHLPQVVARDGLGQVAEQAEDRVLRQGQPRCRLDDGAGPVDSPGRHRSLRTITTGTTARLYWRRGAGGR